MDKKEKLLSDIRDAMLNDGFEPEDIRRIESILIVKLDNFNLTEKSTALDVRDNSDIATVNLYLGTILTEGKSRRTVDAYALLLRTFMRDAKKSLFEVNTFDIRVWLAKRQQCVSLKTVETNRAILSAFYQWLNTEGFIDINPMIKIKPIKLEKVVRLPYSEIEMDKLRVGCKDIRERALFEFMVSTGARVSELCAINIADINMGSKSVIIREGKGNKQRETFFTDIAKRYLKEYLESRKDDCEALFITRNGTRITPSAVQTELRALGKRTGVKDVHPHRCRRTFASGLNKRGMPLNEVQKLMGHSDVNTTMSYIAIGDDMIKNDYMRYA